MMVVSRMLLAMNNQIVYADRKKKSRENGEEK